MHATWLVCNASSAFCLAQGSSSSSHLTWLVRKHHSACVLPADRPSTLQCCFKGPMQGRTLGNLCAAAQSPCPSHQVLLPLLACIHACFSNTTCCLHCLLACIHSCWSNTICCSRCILALPTPCATYTACMHSRSYIFMVMGLIYEATPWLPASKCIQSKALPLERASTHGNAITLFTPGTSLHCLHAYAFY